MSQKEDTVVTYMKSDGKLAKVFHLKGLIRKRNIWLVNHIYAGVNPKYFPKKRKLLNEIGCSIGEGTRIVGPVYFYQNFSIGKNCWLGKNFTIEGDGQVTIGDNCDFGPEVTMLTGGHLIGNHNRRAGEGKIFSVRIGNGCWVGARSTFVGTVKVDDGSVVAAAACVVKDVPSDTLVGGVPAKTIKKLE